MTLVAPVLTREDLAAITAEVWAAFLLAEDIEPTEPIAPAYGVDVQASVSVSGAWQGRILLSLSPEACALAAATMLGVDVVDPDEVSDAIGELVNMVGGNVKSLVPAPSTLGLPVVGRTGAEPDGRLVEECATGIRWAGHRVDVVVSSRHAT